MYSALCWHSLRAPQPGGRRKASSLGSRPLPLHPSAEKSQSLRGSSKQPSVRWKSKGQNTELWPAGPALLLALCTKVFPVLVNANFINCWGQNPGNPTQTVSSRPTPHLLPSPVGLAFKMRLKSITSYFFRCDHQVSSSLSLAQLHKGTFQR